MVTEPGEGRADNRQRKRCRVVQGRCGSGSISGAARTRVDLAEQHDVHVRLADDERVVLDAGLKEDKTGAGAGRGAGTAAVPAHATTRPLTDVTYPMTWRPACSCMLVPLADTVMSNCALPGL